MKRILDDDVQPLRGGSGINSTVVKYRTWWLCANTWTDRLNPATGRCKFQRLTAHAAYPAFRIQARGISIQDLAQTVVG